MKLNGNSSFFKTFLPQLGQKAESSGISVPQNLQYILFQFLD
jgi:hypothetical protein